MNYYIYDCETYPNVFTCVINRVSDDTYHTFEVSDRIDDRYEFLAFIDDIKDTNGRMVGFNNMGFDYQVIHPLLIGKKWRWYEIADFFIHATKEEKFSAMCWNPVIPQVDLFKINHFDNKARSQSLKGVEFALRMDTIQDLPIEPNTTLSNDQIDTLIEYNKHDVKATRLLFNKTLPSIQFRDALSATYNRDFTNYSDVKCGSEVLIHRIEQAGHKCYEPTRDGKEPITTDRSGGMNIGDVLLPYITFERPEFQAIHDHFKTLTVTETKGSITDLQATIDGFTFDYGLGGLHGSVTSQAIHSDNQHVIIDVDVASYYPNLAIANNVYPYHLSEEFCTIYKDIYEERKKHPKGTPENAMLKLALNGAYGNSNNQFSPLCDPLYTMTITVNGQLLLSMLSERLMAIEGCQMIQANTDGITVRIPRKYHTQLQDVCRCWEKITGLTLEEVVYRSMFIRDVNNYVAVYEDGKTKRKGAYEWDYQLHQNPSMPIVAKAAEAHLVGGTDIATFIHNHKDMHDFMMRAKVNRGTQLIHNGKEQQRTTRCYIATEGHSLEKVMPPAGPLGGWKKKPKVTGAPSATEGPVDAQGVIWDSSYHTANQSKHDYRRSNMFEGLPVVICNDIRNFDWRTVDYDWYIKETLKLTEVFE